MKLELQIGNALCYAPVFNINDIEADTLDFVEQYDRSPETAEDYACGDMQATPILATQEVLDKYRITVPEYNLIADQLSAGLSFGGCGWCV